MKIIQLLVFLLLSVTSVVSYSQQLSSVVSLDVKPNRCIALRRGQYCYQKLSFRWQTPAEHTFCLYIKGEQEPLVCWESNKLSQYSYEFKALEDQQFILRDETLEQDIKEVNVDVAWVYKSSKKVSTGWRLF